MKYTGLQLSAMTALAIFASSVDGECDDKEMQIIFGHLGAYILSENERKAIITRALLIPFDEATGIVRQMNISQKRHFCAFLGVIILADGVITNSELQFWKELTYVADLPIMSISEAAQIFFVYMGLSSQKNTSYSSGTGNTGCCIVLAIPIIIIFLALSISYYA